MSIRFKNTLAGIIGLVLLGVVCIWSTVYSMKKQGKAEVQTIRENLMNEKRLKLKEITQTTSTLLSRAYQDAHSTEKVIAMYKQQLHNIINVALTGIEAIDKSTGLTTAEKQKLVMEYIKNIRYNKNNYVWINDSHPTMVMHPMKPALDGKDLSGFADPNGKKLFVEFAKVCQADGEGFVNYMWPKPGKDKPVPKISFVKRYKKWDWILGTGVYLETSEKELMNRAKDEICGLRYGPERKGYFWIHDMELKMVKHPFKPTLNGKSLAAVADPNGKLLFKEMNEVCKKDGEGYVEYMWAKPGSKDPVPKLSYVQLHPETGWIVGTGIYIDDITKVVARQEKQVSQAINAQIRSIIIIALIFILVMIAVFSYISMKITHPISEASGILGEIASGEGDLTTRMEVASNDEIGALANNFNLFVKKLQAIIGKVAENTREVHVSSSDLSGLSDELHRLSEDSSGKTEHVVHSSNEASMNMNSVASAMEEYATNMTAIATATEEMSATIQEIVESTETANSMTQDAMQQTSNMVTQIDSLHLATAKISEFVGTITDISDQVNLLALNATIEAARAGDAGKGFAVVASEIKELARQTSDASTQIQENIGLIVSSSEGTTTEIKKITKVVDQINEIITHIGTALEQQSIATSEITTNISQASEGIGDVNANVSQTAELVHEVQAEVEGVEQNSKQIISQSNKVRDTSGTLRKLSDQLEELVSRFKY